RAGPVADWSIPIARGSIDSYWTILFSGRQPGAHADPGGGSFQGWTGGSDQSFSRRIGSAFAGAPSPANRSSAVLEEVSVIVHSISSSPSFSDTCRTPSFRKTFNVDDGPFVATALVSLP